jgi:hypothetical protein
MSKVPITHNPFSPPPGGAVGGLLPFKPPSPMKVKPQVPQANMFPGGRAANPIFAPAAHAGGLAMPFLAAGGGQPAPQVQMPAMQVMQAPIVPLQAAFHAAPVQTRHQKADIAKEHFKKGAQQIVSNFATQVLPQASGNSVETGTLMLKQLHDFVQSHFQGVASRFFFFNEAALFSSQLSHGFACTSDDCAATASTTPPSRSSCTPLSYTSKCRLTPA